MDKSIEYFLLRSQPVKISGVSAEFPNLELRDSASAKFLAPWQPLSDDFNTDRTDSVLHIISSWNHSSSKLKHKFVHFHSSLSSVVGSCVSLDAPEL
jgi:hypothetical protein